MALDVLGAVITLLKADAGVAALASTRVYGEELSGEEADVKDMPRYAVVVRTVPGAVGEGGYLDLERAAFDVACYGATLYEANVLRHAVAAALKQARRQLVGDVLVHGFNPLTSPSSLREEETKWPVSLQGWEYLAAEVEPA